MIDLGRNKCLVCSMTIFLKSDWKITDVKRQSLFCPIIESLWCLLAFEKLFADNIGHWLVPWLINVHLLCTSKTMLDVSSSCTLKHKTLLYAFRLFSEYVIFIIFLCQQNQHQLWSSYLRIILCLYIKKWFITLCHVMLW